MTWTPTKCCQEMLNGRCKAKKNRKECNKNCLSKVSNRARFTSSEIGYYYDFDFDDNGLPTGCPVFEGNRDEEWYRGQRSIMQGLEDHGCGLQKAKDEQNKPIYKSVQKYANDPELWLEDFVDAFDQMQQNGYTKLETSNNNFWSHRCKFSL